MTTSKATSLVVVGVDGSPDSQIAAEWAAAYANRNGSTLELVSVWQTPSYYGFPMVVPDFDPGAGAQTILQRTASSLDLPEDRIRTTRFEGVAAHVLVELSKHADLLVVGSRGLGGFTGLLLGSVGAHCVHHAHCPVVVVKPSMAHPMPQTNEARVALSTS